MDSILGSASSFSTAISCALGSVELRIPFAAVSRLGPSSALGRSAGQQSCWDNYEEHLLLYCRAPHCQIFYMPIPYVQCCMVQVTQCLLCMGWEVP
mmetsp:Transcript_9554/g.35030  ORF Transcript_9554/g.35030 Transcript_9554/m.35030 type:complete len:96 (+) Transcript_9554:1580-1867(+)